MGEMKPALIAPLGMLHIAERYTHYHFILPHLWKNDLYRYFMTKSKKPKIVDNAIYEGYEFTWEEILAVADELPNVEIVVMPDYLGDYERTIREVRQIAETLPSYDFKVMVVPQASTLPKAIEVYPEFAECGDAVGIPIWFERQFGFLTRVRIAYLLSYTGDWADKHHHLLGLDNPIELRYAWRYYDSFDTSLPFSLAVTETRITDYPPKHRRVDLERVEFTEEQLKCAYENIMMLFSYFRKREKHEG